MTALLIAPVVIAEIRKNGRERVRVSLDKYMGRDLVNARITTQLNAATDDWLPTKKGFSIDVSLIGELVSAFQAAEKQARELGLIGGDA